MVFVALSFALFAQSFFSFTQAPLVPHWSSSLTLQPAPVCWELLLCSEAGQEVSVFPVEVLQAVQSPQNTLEGEKWENQSSISSGSLAGALILCSWSRFFCPWSHFFCPSNNCLVCSFHFSILSLELCWKYEAHQHTEQWPAALTWQLETFYPFSLYYSIFFLTFLFISLFFMWTSKHFHKRVLQHLILWVTCQLLRKEAVIT